MVGYNEGHRIEEGNGVTYLVAYISNTGDRHKGETRYFKGKDERADLIVTVPGKSGDRITYKDGKITYHISGKDIVKRLNRPEVNRLVHVFGEGIFVQGVLETEKIYRIARTDANGNITDTKISKFRVRNKRIISNIQREEIRNPQYTLIDWEN